MMVLFSVKLRIVCVCVCACVCVCVCAEGHSAEQQCVLRGGGVQLGGGDQLRGGGGGGVSLQLSDLRVQLPQGQQPREPALPQERYNTHHCHTRTHTRTS